MTSQIFLSYSTADKEIMEKVRRAFEAEELKIWIDVNGLAPGTDQWTAAIEDALNEAGCVVVITTPSSKKSEWVSKELQTARNKRKKLFPLLASGDEDSIHFILQGIQYTDIRTDKAFSDNMPRLIEAVCRYLKAESRTMRLERLEREETARLKEAEAQERKSAQEAMRRTMKELEAKQRAIAVELEVTRKSYEQMRGSSKQTISYESIPAPNPSDSELTDTTPTGRTRTPQEGAKSNSAAVILSDVDIPIYTEITPTYLLRFGRWLFTNPAGFQTFQRRYGVSEVRKLTGWLASSAVWLLVGLPLIAQLIGLTRPLEQRSFFSTAFWIGMAVTAWFVSGYFQNNGAMMRVVIVVLVGTIGFLTSFSVGVSLAFAFLYAQNLVASILIAIAPLFIVGTASGLVALLRQEYVDDGLFANTGVGASVLSIGLGLSLGATLRLAETIAHNANGGLGAIIVGLFVLVVTLVVTLGGEILSHIITTESIRETIEEGANSTILLALILVAFGVILFVFFTGYWNTIVPL